MVDFILPETLVADTPAAANKLAISTVIWYNKSYSEFPRKMWYNERKEMEELT